MTITTVLHSRAAPSLEIIFCVQISTVTFPHLFFFISPFSPISISLSFDTNYLFLIPKKFPNTKTHTLIIHTHVPSLFKLDAFNFIGKNQIGINVFLSNSVTSFLESIKFICSYKFQVGSPIGLQAEEKKVITFQFIVQKISPRRITIATGSGIDDGTTFCFQLNNK